MLVHLLDGGEIFNELVSVGDRSFDILLDLVDLFQLFVQGKPSLPLAAPGVRDV